MECYYTGTFSYPAYVITYDDMAQEYIAMPFNSSQTNDLKIFCPDVPEYATTIATGTKEFLIKKQYTYGDITTEIFLGFFIFIFMAYFLIKVFTRQDVYLKR